MAKWVSEEDVNEGLHLRHKKKKVKKETIENGKIWLIFIAGMIAFYTCLQSINFSRDPLSFFLSFGANLLVYYLIISLGYYIWHKIYPKKDLVEDEKKEEKEGKRYTKIRGWLAVFIFLLFANAVYEIYDVIVSSYSFPYSILFLGSATLFIICGIALYQKKPYAVKLTKVVLLVELLTIIPLIIMGFVYYSTAIFYVIWLWYLSRSKRVQGIYGSLKYSKKDYELWPLLAVIYAIVHPIMGLVFTGVGISNRKKITKNKRIFLIIPLVLSIIMIGFYFFVIYDSYSNLEYDYYSMELVPASIQERCEFSCTYTNGADAYYFGYDAEAEKYICRCIDIDGTILHEIRFPKFGYPRTLENRE